MLPALLSPCRCCCCCPVRLLEHGAADVGELHMLVAPMSDEELLQVCETNSLHWGMQKRQGTSKARGQSKTCVWVCLWGGMGSWVTQQQPNGACLPWACTLACPHVPAHLHLLTCACHHAPACPIRLPCACPHVPAHVLLIAMCLLLLTCACPSAPAHTCLPAHLPAMPLPCACLSAPARTWLPAPPPPHAPAQVAQERCLAHKCGNPLCSKTLQPETPASKYRCVCVRVCGDSCGKTWK